MRAFVGVVQSRPHVQDAGQGRLAMLTENALRNAEELRGFEASHASPDVDGAQLGLG